MHHFPYYNCNKFYGVGAGEGSGAGQTVWSTTSAIIAVRSHLPRRLNETAQ